MSSSRPVRIARVAVRRPDRPVRLAKPRARAPEAYPEARPELPGPSVVRENRAAVARTNHLAVLYAGGLVVLYAALALYARSAPGGSSSGAGYGLELFGAVAVLLAVAGIVLSFSSAPRTVELGPAATVFVGRFGGRLRLPPLRELDVRVARRIRSGLLAPTVVEQVEITPKGTGRRRSFLLDEHLLDEPDATGA